MKAFIGWLFLWLFMPGMVLAADLDGSTIRLNRNQIAESPLPILVQIKSKTMVIEDGLRLMVGEGWNLDNTIMVSTSELPGGLTSMPLMGNGVKTTGQTIDFPMGDLTAGIDYGFYISGGIGVNPSADNYLWKVATLSSGVETEMMSVGVPTVGTDQVTITGKVGALASDFQLEIKANKSADLAVNEVVTYEIDYGSYLPFPTRPLVISAEWSRGTVIGSPTPSVDIVDYVIGSGTSAFGGVEPIIDLVNRKISWTISSFPANTINHRVSFQLKVNDSYSGQSRVSFEVETLLSGANVVTTNTSVLSYFQPTLSPTPTVTLVPTNTGTSTSQSPSPKPTLVSSSIDLLINKISIGTLSDTQIGIVVECNLAPSELTIRYGLSSKNLNKTITSINNLALDLISIDGLLPNTEYYFKVEAKTREDKSIYSDLYMFRTALNSEGSEIDNSSLIISIDNNVVLDAGTEKEALSSVVMVPNKNYSFRINIKKADLVKMAQIYIRDSQILGINSVYGAEPNSTGVDLLEIVNGGFVGHLISPRRLGFYDVILRLENTNGLIAENKVGILRVVDNFAVKDINLKGIENAKVTFYRYIPRSQTFELMSQQSLGIKNPSFTETDGSLDLSLPKGKYRVVVSAIGYLETERDFALGLGEDEILPKIILEKTKIIEKIGRK